MTTHNDNPGNFANRPKEEVREIASKGGKASHGGHKSHEDKDDNHNDSKTSTTSEEAPSKQLEGHGRNPDGTFTKGSVAAAEAGHKGGLNSHKHDYDHDASESTDGASDEHDESSSYLPGRNPDGTFNKGSQAAAEAGHKGGQNSHKHDHEQDLSKNTDGANDENDEPSHLPGRNPDGTFTKGSQAAAEAGHKGGQNSHKHDGENSKQGEDYSSHLPDRNPDGTFAKGSKAAAEAGHIGGQHSHKRDDSKVDDNEGSSGKDSSHSHLSGRNPDGTFTKGSQAAAEAGHKGGQHS